MTDDASIPRKAEQENCFKLLQEDLNRLYEWIVMWQIDSKVDNCHVMKFGRSEGRP